MRRKWKTDYKRLTDDRRYNNTPRGKFRQQKANAKRRGIAWEITFEEWFNLWEKSGHWNNRGAHAAGYVMSRHGDVGPYKIGNVAIIPLLENVAQVNARRTPTGRPRIEREDSDDWAERERRWAQEYVCNEFNSEEAVPF